MMETCIRSLTKQSACQRRVATTQGRPFPLPGSRIALKLHLNSLWRRYRRRSGATGFNSAATVPVPPAGLPAQPGHVVYATICRPFGHSVSLLRNRQP